ncbi:MAG: hypothetical protein QM493_06590 [Sulfurovum sp.]
MSNKIIKDQNSLNLLSKDKVVCQNKYCSNIVKDVYLAKQLHIQNKLYLVPLCEECYNLETNSTNQSKSNFTDFGSVMSIDEDKMIEFTVNVSQSIEGYPILDTVRKKEIEQLRRKYGIQI